MKKGITFSTFDLLHAGHVAMLREAKEVCDYLICGLQVDPSLDRPEKNAPIQTLVERYIHSLALNMLMRLSAINPRMMLLISSKCLMLM